MAEPTDFSGLYDLHFKKVYNYVRYRVRLPEAADDVTGKVFEAALEKLDSYDPARAPVQVWLFGIARNAVADWFRARSRVEEVYMEDIEQQPGREPRIENVLEEKEDGDRLLKAVAALDPRARDIIALKFSSGMTNRDIAGVTGLGESNIGVIIYRAVKTLQQKLAGKEL
ncbi:MAG TPA: sigma-70 family RNA polymerase sigma factor [Elusimicrobiales bacterium]|nr:sigma-70 family RNA polymerase sigma factor [Elusimicrobiales bacterium]